MFETDTTGIIAPLPAAKVRQTSSSIHHADENARCTDNLCGYCLSKSALKVDSGGKRPMGKTLG